MRTPEQVARKLVSDYGGHMPSIHLLEKHVAALIVRDRREQAALVLPLVKYAVESTTSRTSILLGEFPGMKSKDLAHLERWLAEAEKEAQGE